MKTVRNTGSEADLLPRPLTARSVIASLLLGMRPPRLPSARLVRWCGIFGISEGTARVALSRMLDRGELTATDRVYELAGSLQSRQPAQEWSLHPALREWSGQWSIATVTAASRSATARATLRDAMRALHRAELREGVWVRPDNLPRAAAPTPAWAVADAQCEWWYGRPDDGSPELAARLFAPAAWSDRAHTLLAAVTRATATLGAPGDDELAHAFVVGAAALAHVRADPLLPPECCPLPWPGDELRAAYDDYRRAFATAVRDWFRAAT